MEKDRERDFFAEFKVFLELEGEKRLSGSDLFNLLEKIRTYGSISRAAAVLGLSYRYAWGLINAAEKALGLELVNRQAGGYAGGGAFLSPEGGELLEEYRTFKQEVDLQLQQFMARAAAGKGRAFFIHGEDKEFSREQHLLLASTMEPVETGLLDVLEEAFFQATGVLMRHIALGSGRALEIAREGRVDLILTHAPALEERFLDEGWGKERFPVMANDFILVGPCSDPAGLKRLKNRGDVKEAFRRIALSSSPFISRGDRSGTHLKELQLWEAAGISPGGEWYILSSGIVGNMGVLHLALEKKAYTLVDRAAFLLFRGQKKMRIFSGAAEGSAFPEELRNVFSLILVSPEKVPGVNYRGARLFARWLQGKEAGEIISGFGKERFGRPLFSRGVPL